MHDIKPRLLFIDAYDSFSNNIISLLETTLSCEVRTVKIDDPTLLSSDEALHKELACYDAVVCGPGPGSPENEKDVGIFRKIWRLSDQHLLPVLGICLGFQSLCLEFGGRIQRLKGPQHGIVREVTHVGLEKRGKGTVFEGVGVLRATHYQSLCADIGQDNIANEEWQQKKWLSSSSYADLLPLAYAESDLSVPNNSGIKDERVLVAVQHASKPFFALQYHPESICTEVESHKVISNWYKQAQAWDSERRRGRRQDITPDHGKQVVRPSLLSQNQLVAPRAAIEQREATFCFWETMDAPQHLSVPDSAEWFCTAGSQRILLESTNTNELLEGTVDVRGRFSIIALDVDDAPTFEYHVGSDEITKQDGDTRELYKLKGASPWTYIAQIMQIHHVKEGPAESPFCGGLMGYTTYELGLESIEVASTKQKNRSRPDMCLAWITSSLVVDHRQNKLYIQQLGTKAEEQSIKHKLTEMCSKFEKFVCATTPPLPSNLSDSDSESLHVRTPLSTPSLSTSSSQTDLLASKTQLTPRPPKNTNAHINRPLDSIYETKVSTCQDFISAGDSYELCLTDQTTITRPKSPTSTPWDLYLTLRSRQPAPFASFISLGPATLVSSSPERFLTWDSANHCSLRPMKGTVRKSKDVNTLDKAKALLDVPKEKAENLMIVDLVRHDLHGICGSGNVVVPRLCVVEEYKSVYQMISVVEGRISASSSHTGVDVLAASLPPGSMTGAPKKRSCEILQGIEDRERGLYSGVVGYVDVRGRGDWSVTIRSMFKWGDEDVVVDGEEREKWYIGAGGAVTTLSTPVGEREEMGTKLAGTLGIFMSS